MDLPYALTGNKGIVTQTEAQYLNGDGSRIGVVLILRRVGLVPILSCWIWSAFR
jgi:hypothetical protein